MIKTLLALFRPLHTIASELTHIRKLYEMELANRLVHRDAVEMPLVLITQKPKKGDVEVTYQGDNISPRFKHIDWLDGDNEDFPDDVRQ